MSAQHTPGPWRPLPAEQGEHPFSHVVYAENYGVVGYWKGRKDHHINADWCLTEADARLIAAAPDLLDALQRMVDWAGDMPHTSERLDVIVARVAIAKATGAA